MKRNQFSALALLFLCIVAISACTSSSALTGNSSWPGVATEDNVVYTANGSFIEAVLDGAKLWSYPEEAARNLSFFAAPVIDNSHIYVGTYDNQLHILSKEDGKLVASASVGNNKNKIIASPLIEDGMIYVVSSGGMVSAYTVNVSGEALTPNWQSTLSSEIWVKPALYNGTLFVASMDKKMHLLDAKTGELQQTLPIGAIMSDPVLADGKLYYSTLAKEVDEMDLTTYEIRPVLTAESEIWASPLLMGDKLIAADMNGYIYCVDIASGSLLWKTEKLTAERTGFIASPVQLDESTVLLITESGDVMTYDMEGKSISQRSMNQAVYSTPGVLANGSIIIVPVSDDGSVKAYTPDLKEEWIYSRSAAGKATAEPTAEPTASDAK